MDRLFKQLTNLMKQGTDAALVTVIASGGSVPRGVGAQLLALQSGRVCGTIGGGPCEFDALELAAKMIGEKRSCTHQYALHPQAKEAMGAVCGGEMTIYVQYIAHDDDAWSSVAARIVDRMEARSGGWLIQRMDGGAPALLDERGVLLLGEVPEGSDLCARGCVSVGGYISMPLPVGERAVIFGAGHCAQALVPVLAGVGFRPVVFDDRAEYVNPALFPKADGLICGRYDEIEAYVQLEETDYVVVMTNGHEHDFEVLRQALCMPLTYVGAIGSKKKKAFVEEKLRACGVDETRIACVHTPIGMEIMAVTPEEIAVSIAGEMILERAKRKQQTGEFVKRCPMHG